MPSLNAFTESRIQEQDNMIQMGTLVSSLNQSLLDGGKTNEKARRKQEGKEKRNNEFKPKEEFDPIDEASGSKKYKHQTL